MQHPESHPTLRPARGRLSAALPTGPKPAGFQTACWLGFRRWPANPDFSEVSGNLPAGEGANVFGRHTRFIVWMTFRLVGWEKCRYSWLKKIHFYGNAVFRPPKRSDGYNGVGFNLRAELAEPSRLADRPPRPNDTTNTIALLLQRGVSKY